MNRQTGPSREVRELVLARNDGMCLRCNTSTAVQVHHRKPRGSGGTRNPKINSPANLAGVCLQCHMDIESNRLESYETGWLVSRYRNPAGQVLVTLEGRTAMLLEDGSFVLDGRFDDYPDSAA